MSTFTWQQGRIGSWSIGTNWISTSGTVIPGPLDTAIIDTGVATLDIAATVQALTQDGSAGVAILSGPHGLKITGATNFLGTAEQIGGGATDLQGVSILGSIGASAWLWLDGGRVLQNDGHFTLASGGIVLGSVPGGGTGGGVIDNRAPGTLEISASGTVIAAGSGVTGVNNTGLILADGTGTAVITAKIANSGTINVASGTLAMLGGLSTPGAGLAVAFGAVMEIGAGGLVISRGTFSTLGTLRIDGGTADVAAALLADPQGHIVLSSGTLMLAGHNATIGSLQQDNDFGPASVIASTHLLSLGHLIVSGEAVQTGAGTTTLLQGGTFTAANGVTSLYLDGGRKLVNRGTMLINTGSIVLGSDPRGGAVGGASLANMADTNMDFADGTAVIAGTGLIKFVNAGTISKLSGVGVATIGVSLASGGIIHVGSGTLAFAAGGKSLARNVMVDAAASIGISGGVFAVSGATLALTGAVTLSAGTLDLRHVSAISVDAGLTLRGGLLMLGVRNATLGSLMHTAGTVAGSGMVTVAGATSFGGIAVQTGIGTTLLMGSGTLQPGGTLYLDGGRIVQNADNFIDLGGEIALGHKPSGVASGDANFSNQGTFDIAADGLAIAGGSGNTQFGNLGLLEKTAGSGQASITASLVNLGTVSVASGTLSLGAATGSGQFMVSDSCVLEFRGVVNSGTIAFLANAGTLAIDSPAAFADQIAGFRGGSVIDLASVTATPSLNYSAGTLTVTGGGLTAKLLFSNDLSGYAFHTADNTHGGVLLW